MRFGVYYNAHQALDSNKFYLLEFDMHSGVITEAGVNKGNLFDSSFVTIPASSLKPIYKAGVNNYFRYLDIAGDSLYTHIVVADFDSTYSGGNYRYLRIKRSTNSISQNVIIYPHGIDTYTSYFGGVYFVQNDNGLWNGDSYLARENKGMWYCEKWTFNGTRFIKIAVIDSLQSGAAGLSITRPQPPLNSASGGIKALYQYGDYDEGYKKWKNIIKIVAGSYIIPYSNN